MNIDIHFTDDCKKCVLTRGLNIRTDCNALKFEMSTLCLKNSFNKLRFSLNKKFLAKKK